ncbi:MAG: proline iminopeptidase [Blastocatellia bacterium]|nr:proline iminopeptidase [Blastocatellia bacterium]
MSGTSAPSLCVKANARIESLPMTQLRTLYDPIEPYDTGRLRVSPVHEIYYEQVGNPNGKPVVFLHGGPGGGIVPEYRQFHDPNAYRVVLFDQRGSGQSTPHASLEENTTWDLVADIEKLRVHFGIDKWQVFGGSWGSTLSLAYSETHPDRATELVLRGIFLCRKKEIQWFYQEGTNAIFPDVWEEYVKVIPEAERGDMVSAYHRRLTSDDEAVLLEAARAWSIWEGSTSKLFFDEHSIEKFADAEFAKAFARIECHYFMNNCFFPTDNFLIENVGKIRHIPGVIVQGRYDVVCPMMSAWDLHRAWPEADLRITPDAGHSMMEVGNISALVAATDKFR